MRAISVILSIGMICIGIYGMAIAVDSTGTGYYLGALIVGIIWLIADIIAIKKQKHDRE